MIKVEKDNFIEDKEILLKEYEKAQDSAEHHDKLLWTVTSIIFAALSVLFGFIIKYLTEVKYELITILASFFGLVLCIALWIFIENFRYYKNISYYRCNIIEIKLRMNHHLLTDEEYQKIGKLSKPDPPKILCHRIKQWPVMKLVLLILSFIFLVILSMLAINYF